MSELWKSKNLALHNYLHRRYKLKRLKPVVVIQYEIELFSVHKTKVIDTRYTWANHIRYNNIQLNWVVMLHMENYWYSDIHIKVPNQREKIKSLK